MRALPDNPHPNGGDTQVRQYPAPRSSVSLPWKLAGGALVLALLLPLLVAVSAGSGYAQWWANSRGWSILMHTFLFAGAAASVGTLSGYVLGRAGVGWALLGCVALVVPSSLMGTLWIAVLGRSALLGDWLTVYNWPVAAAVVGLRYVGIAAMIAVVHRRGDNRAARVFMVRHAWWWLSVKPALRPLTAAWLVILLLSGADHVLPSLFLIHTYGTQILIQYNALLDLQGAAALASPMLGVVLFLLLLAGYFGRPYPATDSPRSVDHGSRWWAVAVVALVLGVPGAVLIAQARSPGAVVEAARQMHPELINTARLAVIAAVTCAVFGWFLGEYWVRAWRGGRYSMVPVLMVNLMAPGALLALGVIALFQYPLLHALRDTDAPVLLAYVCRVTPVAALIVFAAGMAQPTAPMAAARVLGVSRWRRWRYVVWPVQRLTLATATIVCLLLVATEVEVSTLLDQAGVSTVGVRLYTLIHTAPQATVSAAAVAVLVWLVPLLAVAGVLARSQTHE